jgi:oxygen-independent coproporphyrinogen III oxidase
VKPISVYVHIPFCTVKCGYCDFNAYAGMDALKGRYRDALLAEVASLHPALEGREIVTVGFGGGTPGEVPPTDILAVIEALRAAAPFSPDAEVTLEANPGTSTEANAAELLKGGVTRLSLGAQTFDPARLAFLDRIHSAQAIGASVRAARAAGCDNVNLDLIYGLPGETLDDWRADLGQALALGTDHLSLYALGVEEGTPLHHRVDSGEVEVPGPDLVADMYELACELLGVAGFEHYEISNWARTGHRSRHNQAYWTDRDYLGLGAGAHGYVDGSRYENIAHPRAYIDAALGGLPGATVAERHELDDATRMSDWVSLRLRMLEGFPVGEFEAKFGFPLDQVAAQWLRDGIAAGVLEMVDDALRLTHRGLLLHGELSVRLLDALQRPRTARPL